MLTALLTFLSLANGPIPTRGYSSDPCAPATADASATLGADVDFRELASNGVQYAAKVGCIRFVADFIVPSDANPASEYGVLDFDLTGRWATLPSDDSACTGSGYSIITYKKAAGARGFMKRVPVVDQHVVEPVAIDVTCIRHLPRRPGEPRLGGDHDALEATTEAVQDNARAVRRAEDHIRPTAVGVTDEHIGESIAVHVSRPCRTRHTCVPRWRRSC